MLQFVKKNLQTQDHMRQYIHKQSSHAVFLSRLPGGVKFKLLWITAHWDKGPHRICKTEQEQIYQSRTQQEQLLQHPTAQSGSALMIQTSWIKHEQLWSHQVSWALEEHCAWENESLHSRSGFLDCHCGQCVNLNGGESLKGGSL